MTNPLVNPELKILSIQVSLDGFSFYINDENDPTSTIAREFPFKNVHTAEQALIEIQNLFEKTHLLQQSFKNIIVIYANELFTIVPKELFVQNNLTDYLKFNTKILKTDFIVYDEIESLDLINVYVPFTNINNFFFDHFGTFTYYHSQSILIKNILERSENYGQAEVFIQVNPKSLDVVVHQGKKLILSNHFQYQTDSDFAYYILFCLEQLKLDPEEIQLILNGHIDEKDSRFLLIYEYVRNVQVVFKEDHSILNNSFLQYNLSL